jgi:EAL domain-containing protein (putative c-di-GMP-specific phosphodiesterase class I)
MIVEAILRLSQSFQRRTVAEGVETAEQEQRLLELGCDVGQGYRYSPPLPLAEALDWANNFNWARYHSGHN